MHLLAKRLQQVKLLPRVNSFKEAIQKMTGDVGVEVLQGTVIAVGPLRIQIKNDEKLVINSNVTYVPWHLTDYITKIDIEIPERIDSWTTVSGAHSHPPIYGGEHKHPLETFNIFGAKLTVYNALKIGEDVYLLSFNRGKQYFVLDRVEK